MSMGIQTVSVDCGCGKRHTVEIDHYGRVRMSCGVIYWALQPKRDGAYMLKPWPGPNLTREEMGGGPSAATIVRRMNEESNRGNIQHSTFNAQHRRGTAPRHREIDEAAALREVEKLLPL
jgi:hypothetical protein